jgi:hypothetical protein
MRLRSRFIVLFALALAAFLGATVPAPRLVLTVGSVTASPGDTLVGVPVYLSNPNDTLAGVEMHLRIDRNPYLYFATDVKRPSGMHEAGDTVGTLMSGWEWVGTSSLDKDSYDLKIAGLADWPNEILHPPMPPQDRGVLINVFFRVKDGVRLDSTVQLPIQINAERTGFSDPAGNSIGLKTVRERRCEKYLGDSCVEWSMARVGRLDTAVVKLTNGLITISDEGSGRK